MAEPLVARVVTSRYSTHRMALVCPSGHEVVDAPKSSREGRRLLAGDFSGEFCGRTDCNWNGDAHA